MNISPAEADARVAQGLAWFKHHGCLWYSKLSYSDGIALGFAVPVLHFGSDTFDEYASVLKAAWLRALKAE